MEKYFVVDSLSTASEEFDGETIVIQFKVGTYSVFSGSGPQIFSMLADPCSAEEIVSAITEASGADPASVSKEVAAFIQSLADAQIIVATDQKHKAVPLEFSGDFTNPEMETFEDLADMMLVDPVHEVDIDKGWPKQVTPPKGPAN